MSVRQIVPNKRLTRSVSKPASGNPNITPKTGDTTASKNPVASQWAETSASAVTASG